MKMNKNVGKYWEEYRYWREIEKCMIVNQEEREKRKMKPNTYINYEELNEINNMKV